MNIINKNLKVKYLSNPYPIWIIDNFFNADTLNIFKKEWPNSESSLWHRGHKFIEDNWL